MSYSLYVPFQISQQHQLIIAIQLGLSVAIQKVCQTLYQYLVIQFARTGDHQYERVSVFKMQERIDKLNENCDDPTWEVLSSVFGALAGKILVQEASKGVPIFLWLKKM